MKMNLGLIIVAYKQWAAGIFLDMVGSCEVGGVILVCQDFVRAEGFINFLPVTDSCNMAEAWMFIKLSWL